MVLRITTNGSMSCCSKSEKFGAFINECRQLMECAKALNVDIIGVSFHVGSGFTDSKIFARAIANARVVFDIGIHLGFHMSLLDIGGGFPGSGDEKISFEETTAVINPALDIYFPEESGVQIIAEPGHYYVTSSFILAVNIIARKIIKKVSTGSKDEEAENKKAIVYYLKDGLYGSFDNTIQYCALLNPILYKKHCRDQVLYNTRIWGPTCAALDHIVDHWKLPELEIGDWLLLQNTPSYTVSTSTTFNGFHGAMAHDVMSKEAWETLQKIKKGNQSPAEEQDNVV